MGVYFVGLASGAPLDISADQGVHPGPPVIPLEEVLGAENSTVPGVGGIVGETDKGETSIFGNIEAITVVEVRFIECPIGWFGTLDGGRGGRH